MKETLHQRIKKIIAPLNSLERAIYFFQEGIRLRVLYGAIVSTPAKEIKKTKLRQVKKEIEDLQVEMEER